MAISKILDFSAGSKFEIKLPQDIRYDRESQNCDSVLFSVTRLKILRTPYVRVNLGQNDRPVLPRKKDSIFEVMDYLKSS